MKFIHSSVRTVTVSESVPAGVTYVNQKKKDDDESTRLGSDIIIRMHAMQGHPAEGARGAKKVKN